MAAAKNSRRRPHLPSSNSPVTGDLSARRRGMGGAGGRRNTQPDPASRRDSADVSAAAHRIQFEFAPDAYRRLTQLQTDTEGATKAEVVRQALRLYEWLTEKAKEGRSITLSVNGDVEGPIDLRLIVPLTRKRESD